MLRSIQKLIGDKRKQLIFPIFLMSLDAIGSLVMYLMLYFTVIHLLNGSLTGGLVRNYTIVCLISADYLPQRLFSLLFQRGRNVQRPTLGFGKPLPFSKPWLF